MTDYHRFSHEAMATAFEIIIAQDDVDATYAAQAAEAVFAEIDRLEDELSRFRPTSEISRLNRLRAGESLAVSLAAWDCLNLAKSVHAETDGAFDITIGPLMQLWRSPDGSLHEPEAERLALARKSIGSELFELEEDGCRVRALADHMVFDLGAVGKGYALDQAVQILQDWEISRVFLNAGDSTLLALDGPSGEEAWPVTLAEGALEKTLRDQALSGSGFMVQGAHLMNPRTLRPVPVQEKRSYALAPTAALSDALSTAFMIMSPEEIHTLCTRYPGVAWLEL
ncbi:thiamine biosynthesis lipoprotein [Prosthecobacter fusiformis]|uniref:FAD:protein FMN transferase n=1 Tax=Prosthecobacter fusiformis TaxID=48464 RepID=A0A4R7S604_9BACT|nr:FAD:protein FMN transferase [Prosthecobacter fusiformis]TDU72835.1 thiamine biosynthesis lipoprotein [Prosthecobacter fusiformis]